MFVPVVELEEEQKGVNSGTREKDKGSCLTVPQMPEIVSVGTITVLLKVTPPLKEEEERFPAADELTRA